MNRTTMTTRVRRWTTALVVCEVISTTSLSTMVARAQDQSGNLTPPQVRVQPSDDEAPRRATLEFQAPRPHLIRDWQEGEPIPPGYHPSHRVRRGAIIGGAITFGSLYLLSVIIAAAGQDAANAGSNHSSNPVAGLYVPVVGPVIAITQVSSATASVFLVLDGLGQAAGAVLLLYGLTSPQTVLVRDDYGRPRLLPQPMLFGTNGAGLGLTGNF